MKIDLTTLKNGSEKKLFSGLSNGADFRKFIFDPNDMTKLEIEVDDGCVVTSSFYIGLLSDFFEYYLVSDKKTPMRNVVFINGVAYHQNMSSEFERAIYRHKSEFKESVAFNESLKRVTFNQKQCSFLKMKISEIITNEDEASKLLATIKDK